MQFPHAQKGVSKLFWAEIIAIVYGLLAIVGAILVAAANGDSESGLAIAGGSIVLVGGVIAIVTFILQLIGLIQGSKDNLCFKIALFIVIFSIVASIVKVILEKYAPNLDIVITILEVFIGVSAVLVMVYVITGVSVMAEKVGDDRLAGKGRFLCTVICGLYFVSIILGIFELFFKNPNEGVVIMLRVFAIVAAVFQLVVYIMYLTYLSAARKTLKK